MVFGRYLAFGYLDSSRSALGVWDLRHAAEEDASERLKMQALESVALSRKLERPHRHKDPSFWL